MPPLRIALVGIGKIARDQHLPVLASDPAFDLVAGVSRHHELEGLPNFESLDALLRSGPDIDAVSLCTPPQPRFAIARDALENGLHVMLEKPPGATLNEVDSLREIAAAAGRTLFATWHSREAAGVEPARQALADTTLESVRIDWREDVRVWHPGQAWIWTAGGLGVFDPGINALSIVTRILPERLRLVAATLRFPSNCETPIAADLRFTGDRGTPVSASFDFLHADGPPVWEIDVRHSSGRLRLEQGGAVLRVDDADPVPAENREYARLYRRFARLVRAGESDVDAEPLRLVADAFLCGRRVLTEPFIE